MWRVCWVPSVRLDGAGERAVPAEEAVLLRWLLDDWRFLHGLCIAGEEWHDDSRRLYVKEASQMFKLCKCKPWLGRILIGRLARNGKREKLLRDIAERLGLLNPK